MTMTKPTPKASDSATRVAMLSSPAASASIVAASMGPKPMSRPAEMPERKSPVAGRSSCSAPMEISWRRIVAAGFVASP